jgi:hypothetical protein
VPDYLPILATLADQQQGYFTHNQAVRAGVTAEVLSELQTAYVIEGARYRNSVYRLRGGAPGDPLRYYTAWLLLDDERPAWERQPPQCSVAWKATALEWWGIPANTYNSTAQFVHPAVESRITDAGGSEIVINTVSLNDRDWILHRGLPVTTPARTLADMAQFANPEELGLFAHKFLRQGVHLREIEKELTELLNGDRKEFPTYFGWTGIDALTYWADAGNMPTEQFAQLRTENS